MITIKIFMSFVMFSCCFLILIKNFVKDKENIFPSYCYYVALVYLFFYLIDC